MDNDEKRPYCANCGEDKHIAYLACYGDGEWWRCKRCKEQFPFALPKEEE